MTVIPSQVSLIIIVQLLTGCLQRLVASSLQSAYSDAIKEGGNPRVMLINSPSNPTGQSFSQENLDIITDFCEQHGIVLISDEIYSDITYDDKFRTSACQGDKFNAGFKVLTGGLSKVNMVFFNYLV